MIDYVIQYTKESDNMVSAEYTIAYSEVLEILKYIPKEEYNKIPLDMIKMFKLNASSENNFRYDSHKTLQEQNVSEITRTLIAILYRDYWATKEQKEKILALQNLEREKHKRERYNPDNLFKNTKQNEIRGENVHNENMPMKKYKESILKRFFNKIKRLFKK